MNETERQWVVEARQGSQEAFGRLVAVHWSGLVQLARSIVGDSECEDLTQDALVGAWSKLADLRDPLAFSSWLRQVVARRCLRHARRSRWMAPLDSLWNRAAPLSDLDGRLDIERFLLSLPPRQRAVLHMTVVLGMTDREIGEALGLRPATVRAHRRRARQKLTSPQRRPGKEPLEYPL